MGSRRWPFNGQREAACGKRIIEPSEPGTRPISGLHPAAPNSERQPQPGPEVAKRNIYTSVYIPNRLNACWIARSQLPM